MNVLVTGASSGLGAALAAALANRYPGLTLGLVARREAELHRLADTLDARSEVLVADLAQAGAMRALAAGYLERHGVPDWVIGNAGISAGTVTGQVGDAEVFRRIVDLNLTALQETFEPFVEPMRQRGSGRLVGIASVAGIRGLPGAGAYSASKAGAIAYLESLRVELHGSGVGVTTVAPGYIRTPMTANNPYRMPFLMEAPVFAEKALDAIVAQRRFVVIPWQMGWVARLLRLLPPALFDHLFARAPRKPRGGADPGARH